MKKTVSVPARIKRRVEARMEECRKTILNRYGKDIRPSVTYDVRGTVDGYGGCRYGEPFIRLNAVLLIENEDSMMDDTVPHEFAHAVQRKIYADKWDNKPHGRYWKEIMGVLGYKPDRCHSYDVTNARVRNVNRVEYRCKCDTKHQITTAKHRKIQNGFRCWCKRCNTLLALPGQPLVSRFTSRFTPNTKTMTMEKKVTEKLLKPEKVTDTHRWVRPMEDTGPVVSTRTVFNPLTCTLENVPV